MTRKPAPATTFSWSSTVLCLAGVLLLSTFAGTGGLWGGLAQGAGIALVLIGAALLGAAVGSNKWRKLGWWLPSRDSRTDDEGPRDE